MCFFFVNEIHLEKGHFPSDNACKQGYVSRIRIRDDNLPYGLVSSVYNIEIRSVGNSGGHIEYSLSANSIGSATIASRFGKRADQGIGDNG